MTAQIARLPIRTDVNNLNNVVTLLEKTLEEANEQLKPLLREGLKRAKLEQAHFQDQLNSALSSTADHRTDTNRDSTQTACTVAQGVGDACYLSTPVTISGENSNFNAADNKRAAAEADLRAKARARETATGNVVMEFESSSSFYKQGVDRRQYLKDVADANVARAGTSASAGLRKLAEDAQKALEAAQKAQTSYTALVSDPDNPVNSLISELVKADGDDGGALVDAISSTYDDTQTNKGEIDALKGQLTDAEGNPIDLSNLGNAEEIAELTTDVSTNTTNIEGLDGRVADNEEDIAQINMDLYGTTSSQHADASACAEGAGGLVNIANCADARSRHNEDDIADLGGDIEDLDGRVGDNEDAIAANTMAIESNDMDIAANTAAIESNDMDIAANTMAIESNDMDIMTNAGNIAMNAEDIMTNSGNISDNAGNIMANEMSIGANAGRISSNADAIAANMNSIGANASAISDNRNMIGELSDDLDVVRAGVAASMALAGMPAVNGRGIAIGVGSFDGESAFAVGFQIQGEQASFKVGVTSSGGATGASAGVGFNF